MTHAEWIYHHAALLPPAQARADIRRLRACIHLIEIAIGDKPDRGELNNAADAEAIKHGS